MGGLEQKPYALTESQIFRVWPDLAQYMSMLSYDSLVLKILEILFEPN